MYWEGISEKRTLLQKGCLKRFPFWKKHKKLFWDSMLGYWLVLSILIGLFVIMKCDVIQYNPPRTIQVDYQVHIVNTNADVDYMCSNIGIWEYVRPKDDHPFTVVHPVIRADSGTYQMRCPYFVTFSKIGEYYFGASTIPKENGLYSMYRTKTLDVATTFPVVWEKVGESLPRRNQQFTSNSEVIVKVDDAKVYESIDGRDWKEVYTLPSVVQSWRTSFIDGTFLFYGLPARNVPSILISHDLVTFSNFTNDNVVANRIRPLDKGDLLISGWHQEEAGVWKTSRDGKSLELILKNGIGRSHVFIDAIIVDGFGMALKYDASQNHYEVWIKEPETAFSKNVVINQTISEDEWFNLGISYVDRMFIVIGVYSTGSVYVWRPDRSHNVEYQGPSFPMYATIHSAVNFQEKYIICTTEGLWSSTDLEEWDHLTLFPQNQNCHSISHANSLVFVSDESETNFGSDFQKFVGKFAFPTDSVIFFGGVYWFASTNNLYWSENLKDFSKQSYPGRGSKISFLRIVQRDQVMIVHDDYSIWEMTTNKTLKLIYQTDMKIVIEAVVIAENNQMAIKLSTNLIEMYPTKKTCSFMDSINRMVYLPKKRKYFAVGSVYSWLSTDACEWKSMESESALYQWDILEKENGNVLSFGTNGIIIEHTL